MNKAIGVMMVVMTIIAIVALYKATPSATKTVAVEVTRIVKGCDEGNKKECDYLEAVGRQSKGRSL